MWKEAVTKSVDGICIFGMAATILAIAAHDSAINNLDRLVVRFIIELPLLIIAAGIGLLLINVVAGRVGALLNSVVLSGLFAGMSAWIIAAGPSSFAGLGFHSLLQPGYAIAAAVPWVARMGLRDLLLRRR